MPRDRRLLMGFVDVEDRSANTPARALDAQEVSQDLKHSKRRSVTGVTDLEIDRAHVELVLGRNGSRTAPRRIRQGEARGGSPRTSKTT
jgi:hypothetical protein